MFLFFDFLLVYMVVVFLGDFDTPTPEVVTCKTSGPGDSGTVTLPTGSSGTPWFDLFICHISLQSLICVKSYHHQYFYCDTITRQAASQDWRPPSVHEAISCIRPDANPVFRDHGVIIIIIIIDSNWIHLPLRNRHYEITWI